MSSDAFLALFALFALFALMLLLLSAHLPKKETPCLFIRT